MSHDLAAKFALASLLLLEMTTGHAFGVAGAVKQLPHDRLLDAHGF